MKSGRRVSTADCHEAASAAANTAERMKDATLTENPRVLVAFSCRPVSPHYSREMRDQSQTVDIAHNYANGLFDEVFCNEISGPGVWWPRPISGGPMNYSG